MQAGAGFVSRVLRQLLLVLAVSVALPGCHSPGTLTDLSEPSNCSDGKDNDIDGWIDELDPDCFGGHMEVGHGDTACNDGEDNDGDGLKDSRDDGCTEALDDDEGDSSSWCSDGWDNDGDFWTDEDDPDCQDPGNGETGYGDTDCNDGVDNDADGLTDADDTGCPDAWDTDEERLADMVQTYGLTPGQAERKVTAESPETEDDA